MRFSSDPLPGCQVPLEDVAQSERRLVLLENVHRPRLKVGDVDVEWKPSVFHNLWCSTRHFGRVPTAFHGLLGRFLEAFGGDALLRRWRKVFRRSCPRSKRSAGLPALAFGPNVR